jgi:hypothetical protein
MEPARRSPRLIALGTTVLAALIAPLAWPGIASAQSSTGTLDGSMFALALAPASGPSANQTLSTAALTTYFSAARCSCPVNLTVTLALSDDGATALGGDTIQATLALGTACDQVTVPCPPVGSPLTLTAQQTTATTTIPSAAVYAAAGASSCATLQQTSTRLWATLLRGSTTVANAPTLVLGVGGTGPQPPTAVTATTADSGLRVSWTSTADATTLSGYQVLCAPGADPAVPPAYDDSCTAALPTGGTGPFATLDPSLLCSGLVASGSSVLVHGLTNGTAYQVAVIAIGVDGTPSLPSAVAQATPGPTLGFDDLYKKEGGSGLGGGCALGGARTASGGGAGWTAALSAMAAITLASARRRRRRRARRGLLAAAGAVAVLAAGPARAGPGDEAYTPSPILAEPADTSATASPRNWNLELRFGPYRPDVDSELADKGLPGRPFAETFGDSNRLMAGLEIDRQVLHRGGTLALGLGVGYWHASAASLSADLTTRTGDTTTLRLIPLSLSLVYRADTFHQRNGFPLVPYAKAGLDCVPWSISDSSKSSSTSGSTLGWHGALGVSLSLDFLDPEAVHALDQDAGVNDTAVFFEVAHYDISGFGASNQLRLGDTTWLAGLMLEL